MEGLTAFIKMKAFEENRPVPDELIDYYVDSIIYDKGKFRWILNPIIGNKVNAIEIDASELKKKTLSSKLMCEDNSSTGSYRK